MCPLTAILVVKESLQPPQCKNVLPSDIFGGEIVNWIYIWILDWKDGTCDVKDVMLGGFIDIESDF